MSNQRDGKIVRFTKDKVIILGPSFEFWLNEEDSVYDELYADKETIAEGGSAAGEEPSTDI